MEEQHIAATEYTSSTELEKDSSLIWIEDQIMKYIITAV